MESTDSTTNNTPRVSVIIPAHNTAQFIAETLDSVFAQTSQDFEVIVINDGSPDTPELEAALQPFMTRIHYIKQENRGLPGARNTGIRQARGEFLAFLDSDDIWLPEYLAEQVNFLEDHPRVDTSITDALLFGAPGGEVIWRMLKNSGTNIVTFEQALKREGAQLPSATMARRLRVIEAGMFDEQLRIGEDIDFSVRLCFPDGAIGYLGKVLVKYRQRSGSLTNDPQNRKWNVAEIHALRRLGEKLALTDAQRAILGDEIASCEAALALSDAYQHFTEDNFKQGAACLRQANTYYHDARITGALLGLKVFPRWTAHLLNRRLQRG